ncbi:SubName: Full=Uncharacterized protein {ECO:0000313/EMBL:CCA73758.1} [Serendipita indica DSM 11827]|nr:SubName: Full=Uncharacterized protein {ECO:0000313/EMBL:CCA73758.1} [Serendipita indica DSM 11827]
MEAHLESPLLDTASTFDSQPVSLRQTFSFKVLKSLFRSRRMRRDQTTRQVLQWLSESSPKDPVRSRRYMINSYDSVFGHEKASRQRASGSSGSESTSSFEPQSPPLTLEEAIFERDMLVTVSDMRHLQSRSRRIRVNTLQY